MFLDVRWRRLIYNFSDKLLSFYLNYMADTLQSLANLLMWKMPHWVRALFATINNHCTLFRILSHCRHLLMTGRYNWRHDMVLRKIIAVTLPTLQMKTVAQKGTRFKSSKGNDYFVPR